MDKKYSALFRPLTIGNMTLKNRIALTPVLTMLADNTITPRQIDFYAERARGGVGMVMTEGFAPASIGVSPIAPALFNPLMIGKLCELSEAVHAGGAKLCIEFGFGGGRNTPDAQGNALSSSECAPLGHPDKKCTPLSIEQIKQTVGEVAYSTSVCMQGGVDAIVIHAHNGYMLDNFISSGWNLRTDEYGGDVNGRMKFPLEIIQAIRSAAGPDFPIIFRITLDPIVPGIRDKDETIEVLKLLNTSGISAIDVDCGVYESIDHIFPSYYIKEGSALYAADWVKEAGMTMPVLNAGNLNPEVAAKAIEDGRIDVALFGRPLIADPQMPNKLLYDEESDIRPCIKCNMGCLHRGYTRLGNLSCAVNPECSYERRIHEVRPCQADERVAIIGSGLAGLEAARMAAQRGAKVTIYEQGKTVGGTARLIATPTWKYRFRDLFTWYERQMNKYGVKIKLNTKITSDSSELKDATRILVATGSLPIVPPIEGIHNKNVINVLDAHRDEKAVSGEKVVVCGGGMSGCELALELAEKGKKVTVVDMLPAVAQDAARYNGMTLLKKLSDLGVEIKTNTKVLSFEGDKVIAETDGSKIEIQADTIVHAFGIKPNNNIGVELMQKYPGIVQIIGDAEKVNCIYDAVHSGYNAGVSIY